MSSVRRRNPTASRRSRGITWNRVAFYAVRLVLMTVAAAFFIAIVAKGLHPYRLNFTEGRQLAQDRARRDAIIADNDRLSRRIKHLKTQEGEVAQARSLGYHNADEHPLRIEEPETKPTPR